MANAKPEAVSELLDMVACEAIGASLDALAEGRELNPTAYYAGADVQVEQLEFSDDGPDVCLEEARKHIGGLGKDVTAYAIAYDGFVQETADTPSVDAVIVEFGERGARSAYSASVAYEFDADGNLLYGEPVPAGEEPLLLK